MAREDDAERAVRAALQIVEAVDALGGEVGADLRARAGIVTGQVALAAKPGEGLVVGDRVNTAARVQTAAEPGAVLVDDITRQANSAAISYEDAGQHRLKGKSEPMQLWLAVAAPSERPDLERERLHARFVGRDADLRLVKELFHDAVERRSARLVAVSGPAGVGKTRLRWEFLDYLAALPETVLWHPGRCLPYGDGVAYWALAEMVRHRLGIREDAPADEALAKLHAGLEQWIDDDADRGFISPRLGVLLGVAEPGPSREELFAGWRLFFERLAERHPVVMAFEDMRWADDGLLDFVEYLLDWSARHRIFILTFARPELAERRSGWPVGRRGATALYLEPLGDEAMKALLDSVATLPEAANRKIISRAEGIPLYAIETVRALAHRGALQHRDATLVLVSDLGELDVPPSLTSLLEARLDALEADERDLVKSMAVFGGSFPPPAVQAVAEVDPVRAEALLASLVRKQVLTVRADPMSPDRGQYRFAQTMLRTVAYEMLSRRERKARHLVAGHYLSRTFANEGEDVAEVVAAHYLQAYRCATKDADAEQLRAEAVTALRRGAARAAALGAPQAAEHAYRSAIELAVTDEERIGLMEAAANMALLDGRYEVSLELFEDLTARLGNLGREPDAARLGPRIGQALFRAGRPLEMIERLRQGLRVLGSDSEDADVARMNVELGVALLSAGQIRDAFEPLERALEVAQALDLPDVLAGALTYKAQACDAVGRAQEARMLFDGAIDLCRSHELTEPLYFAQLNSGDFLSRFDLPGWAARTEEALTTARRIGSRHYESLAASNLMRGWEYSGKWDEVERLGAELLGQSGDRPGAEALNFELGIVAALRGELAAARGHLDRIASWRDSKSNELRWQYAAGEATVAVAAGDFASALELLLGTLGEIIELEGPRSLAGRIGFPPAVTAAVSLGRLGEAADLLSLLAERRGHVPPYLRAHLARGHGLVAAARGEVETAEGQLGAAAEQLASLGFPYWLAVVRTELSGVLIGEGRGAEARSLLDEAIVALRRLGAAPALRRAGELAAGLRIPADS